jgi:4-hydroxybenzoate polyprenyltransferase
MWRRLRGLIQASHPFPIVMVMSLTALVGLASSRGHADPAMLGAALAAMLFSQLGIGWSNDYLDRERDARFQPDKPVPSGAVPAPLLATLAPVSLGLSLAAGIPLGWPAIGWLIAGTACGLVYNFALKETALSWLPYVVAFAVLPPFVWSAAESYRGAFLWLYPLCAPLAVAAHLANSMPDIEADTASGAGGIVVRLGRGRALGLLYACLLLPAASIALSAPFLDYDDTVLAGVLMPYAALVVVSVPVYRSRPFERGAAIGFRIVAPASVLLAAGWLAAVK